MADAPLVCSLSTDELGARRAQLLPGLLAAATRIDQLTDGYRLTFTPAPGVVETIARVIDAERQCCRFLRFQLLVEQDAAPITLEVTGPAGTKDCFERFLRIRCQEASSFSICAISFNRQSAICNLQ